MFLKKVKSENPELVEAAFLLHQNGKILPDSYMVDMDSLLENAKKMLKKADEHKIRLYFMLKQIGRNPYIAKKLMKVGFAGAVVVDFKEAQIMMHNNIPIGNIGHLVQIPTAMINEVVKYRPEVITVYSIEKAMQISRAAAAQGIVQKLLLRVYDENDMIYSSQTAGFHIKEIKNITEKIQQFSGVEVVGVTSFPCYVYSEEKMDFVATNNLNTVMKAVEILKSIGISPEIINTPSANCCVTLDMMKKDGGNCGEPGHGLTGTTPAHAEKIMDEKTCVVYVSEISHDFGGKSYCYGGGHYRRSHMKNALIGTTIEDAEESEVIAPELEGIDYHFGLNKKFAVGDTVIMAFRFQVFVTRADVVLVEGIQSGKPKIVGIYDSLGMEKQT